MNPLKVAVIGTGYLGAVHARIYHELPEAELVAVVDSDAKRAREIGAKYKAEPLTDHRALIAPGAPRVDCVSIATPTTSHHAIAKECLEAGVHCMVEKPITTTVEQAEELCAIAETRGVALAVGHVERFNPAFIALRDHIRDPKFIEAHRLTQFRFRSIDVGVVLDLMIHDLDLILSLVQGDVIDIKAAGVNIISPKHEDIANCRLTFSSGAVANVTASRISDKPMRRIRFFTPECYATVDLAERAAFIYRKTAHMESFDPSTVNLAEIGDPQYFLYNKLIDVQKVTIEEAEPLKLELRSFLKAVQSGNEPVVTGEHATRAIRLAFRILDAIREHADHYHAATGQ